MNSVYDVVVPHGRRYAVDYIPDAWTHEDFRQLWRLMSAVQELALDLRLGTNDLIGAVLDR